MLQINLSKNFKSEVLTRFLVGLSPDGEGHFEPSKPVDFSYHC